MFKKIITTVVLFCASSAILASPANPANLTSVDFKTVKKAASGVVFTIYSAKPDAILINASPGVDIHKLVFHVNPYISGTRLRSDPVTIRCNGTVHRVLANDTVVCLRHGDNAGYFGVEYVDFRNGSEGTVTVA